MCKQKNIVAVSALVVLIVSLFLALSSSIVIAYFHISGRYYKLTFVTALLDTLRLLTILHSDWDLFTGTVPAPMCNEYKTDSGTENNQELGIYYSPKYLNSC